MVWLEHEADEADAAAAEGRRSTQRTSQDAADAEPEPELAAVSDETKDEDADQSEQQQQQTEPAADEGFTFNIIFMSPTTKSPSDSEKHLVA